MGGKNMNKKIFVVLVSILSIAAVLLAGCAGTVSSTIPVATSSTASANQTGRLVVSVTDAPPKADITSIMVTVSSVQVHVAATNTPSDTVTVTPTPTSPTATVTPTTTTVASPTATPTETVAPTTTPATTTPTATVTPTTTPEATGSVSDDAADSENTGWIDLKLTGPTTFDLLALKALAANGGLTQLLGNADLPTGTYTQIRMEVKKVTVTIGNGTPQTATVPSGKIKFIQLFKIVNGQTTGLVFDFDAAQSVNVTGNGNIMFKPVIRLTVAKEYGKK
jgi:hypothetical protein